MTEGCAPADPCDDDVEAVLWISAITVVDNIPPPTLHATLLRRIFLPKSNKCKMVEKDLSNNVARRRTDVGAPDSRFRDQHLPISSMGTNTGQNNTLKAVTLPNTVSQRLAALEHFLF